MIEWKKMDSFEYDDNMYLFLTDNHTIFKGFCHSEEIYVDLIEQEGPDKTVPLDTIIGFYRLHIYEVYPW